MKKKFAFFTVLAMAGAMLLTGCGNGQGAASAETTGVAQAATPPAVSIGTSAANAGNTVMVQSSEKVTVIPDIAQVVFSVRSEAVSAADCQQKNTEEVRKVTDLLLSLGIAETSIQTSDYFMSPVYSYTNNVQKVQGYEANTSLTVSDLPIDSLGEVLTQSVAAGINYVNSITYQASGYDASYQEALALAMDSAKGKAEVLANAGGCTLGSVASIIENSGYTEARYQDNALASKAQAAGMMNTQEDLAAAAQVMPGQIEVEVSLTVEYFLSPSAN